jgi:hypothetical protein
MRANHSIRGAAVAVAFLSSAAGAQLPNASTAAFGMGGNFTAIARGYEAVRWNPANLAMPGRPLFSLGIGIGGGNTGLEPIDLKTLHDFSGIDVPADVASSWIEQARLAGGQRGRLDGGITPIALSLGPIGIQAGASFAGTMNLNPDAFEALLTGNDNAGQPKNLDLTGTSVRAMAVSAGAASLALPIPINFTNGLLRNERAAIAINGKFIVGNGLVLAQDAGSVFGNNIQIDLPMIRHDTTDYNYMVGTGIGADVALSWSGGPWRVGAMVENVYNSFKWDTTKMVFAPGTATIDSDGAVVSFDTEAPFSSAPAEMRQAVIDQKLKPTIAVGAALALSKSLTLTADIKQATGGDEAIVFGPKSHFGVGAEWRVLPFLPLRGGVASVTDGWQAAAGAGLRLLGYEFGIATSVRRRGQAMESGVMFGIIGIGR